MKSLPSLMKSTSMTSSNQIRANKQQSKQHTHVSQSSHRHKQIKPNVSHVQNQMNPQLLSLIDKALKHLNQISSANFASQQLYIELLKEKKTMKFDQIRKIYDILTESKAKQILFERDKNIIKTTDYQNNEGLVRICWRSLQKLVKKITYYMINQNHLGVISKNVLKLIQLNQQFVRRFQKLKNSSMLFILEIIEKLIQENCILEKKIYQILLDRGYVMSLDEFYKLNAYESKHDGQDFYSKNQNQVIKQQNQNSQSEDSDIQKNNQNKQIKTNNKEISQKNNIRKKKGLRLDCRYSWRQPNNIGSFGNVQIDQKQQKEQIPINKTNYQIRQSFQKFIGDFLENQNFNEMLEGYNFDMDQQQPQQQQKPTSPSNTNIINPQGIIKKKIFQNKIQSVINQLKSNNVKVTSKLLEIIQNSSSQAVSNHKGFQRKAERKNSSKRESSTGNIIKSQRKSRDSYLISDRKIVNQNFFRQLLKRNSTFQTQLTKDILLDHQNLKQQINQHSSHKKINSNILQFGNKQHKSKFLTQAKAKYKQINTNSSLQNLNKISKKVDDRITKQPLIKNKLNQQTKTLEIVENKFHYSQMISSIKQQEQIKLNKNILDFIENSHIDPSNPYKFVQTLQKFNQFRQNLTRTQKSQKQQVLQLPKQLDKIQSKISKCQETQNNRPNIKQRNYYSKATKGRISQMMQQNRSKTEINEWANSIFHQNSYFKENINLKKKVFKGHKHLEIFNEIDANQKNNLKKQQLNKTNYRLKVSKTQMNIQNNAQLNNTTQLNSKKTNLSKHKKRGYQVYDRRLRRFIPTK